MAGRARRRHEPRSTLRTQHIHGFAVVALVAALLGLSARAPQLALFDATPRRRPLSRRVGTAVAAACLTGAAAIVLVRLWVMIVR